MRAATLFRRDDFVFASLFVTMIVLAWLGLSIWSASPYGRYLDHGSWLELGSLAAICEAVPGGEVIVPMALHAGAWLLMCAAMMLPTTLPLLVTWRRLVSGRPDRLLLLGLVIAGYLAVWGAFGIAANLADTGLHRLVESSAWLARNGWVFGVGTLGLAGLFQFSRLKDYCLDRCRSPLGFALGAWRGGTPHRQALWLGLHHGAYCAGCCWALMMLMFVVGMGNIAWMLLLAAMMAAEKNLPWGHRLTKPMGATLLVAAAFIAGASAAN